MKKIYIVFLVFFILLTTESCKKEQKYVYIEIYNRQTGELLQKVNSVNVITKFEETINNSSKVEALVHARNFEYYLKCFDKNNNIEEMLLKDKVVNMEKGHYETESSFYEIFNLSNDPNGDNVPN